MNSYRMLALILLSFSSGAAGAGESATAQGTWNTFAVDDYRLAYRCSGSGAPTLILEPPSGISAETAFEGIIDGLARENRVCIYERLSFGGSDELPAGMVQTVKDYSDELLHFVREIASGEKVVLVGYSFGGFITRYFAATHPDRVAGLLLIDSAQEDWIVELKARMSPSDWSKMQDILDWFVTNLGHNYWDSQFEVASVSLPQNLPVRIISRGLPYQRIRKANLSEEGVDLYNESHDKYQFELLKLTGNTSRVVAENSEHLIVESEPGLVIAELRKLLEQTAVRE